MDEHAHGRPRPPSAAEGDGAAKGSVAELGAEAKLRALIEQISAITYTWEWRDDRYSVIYCSPQIESILGYTPDEWTARPTDWYDWVHPDDRESVIQENKRCEISGEAYSMCYRMVRKDGRVIWVEDSWVVVADTADGGLFQGVVFDVTERKQAEKEIQFLARHDKLTGLSNRAAFEEALDLSLSRARRKDLGVALLFLDMDNFKLVNDSLGHHVGDLLLSKIAERLRGCTRETDVLARQGGDEFLILLSDLERPVGESDETALAAATRVATRIREVLAQPFEIAGRQFYASGSIGISVFPEDGIDADALMRAADAAMYQAKRQSPGAFLRYTTRTEDGDDKLSMSSRLRRSVERGDWLLHYQPIVDLADGRMTGVEALIRWADPNGGLVPPGEFIPLAEELGLIEAIGDWVIDEIARQHRAWSDQGLELETSFNLSPRQLWSKNLPERILGKLSDAGVDPRKVVVEITESSAMAEPDRTQKILAELRAWGLKLAIDDFGTGYSSLSRLKHLPVDILKIDRAFVRDADRDVGLAGMVRAMIQLAQSLNLTPLAEGVEAHGEYEFLRSNGCRLAQGFYLARPVGPGEIVEMARRGLTLVPPEPRSGPDTAGLLGSSSVGT
jgi:diguanylate cyclase (GGDEF)-like protein/PAS domain S-box-containing protein